MCEPPSVSASEARVTACLVVESTSSDGQWKTKLGWYKKCNYDLTRAIAEDLAGGKKTKLSQTVEKYDLHPYESWTP